MKKIKILGLILALTVILSVFAGLPASAASTTINVNTKTPELGGTFTATVTINGDEAMYATEAYFSFDSNVLEFVSGDSANLVDGKVKIIGTPGGAQKQSYTLTFKVKASGSCSIAAEGVKYVGNEEVSVSGAGVGGITVKEPEAPKSSNNNLTSLTVNHGTLTPAFSPDITNYTVDVENDIANIVVNATAAEGATVDGTGSSKLRVGTTNLKFNVVAQDGSKKTYYIKVTRAKEESDVSSEEVSSEESTSSETTSSEETVSPDSLATFINNEKYHVLETLPQDASAPQGFTAGKSTYNGKEVDVYESANKDFIIFNLKNDATEKTGYYTYDSTRDEFVSLKYMNFGDKMYILPNIPAEYIPPKGYIRTTANIGNATPVVFCSEDPRMADFCIFYAYVNGKYGYFSYDMQEQTIQRAPLFEPEIQESKPADNKTEHKNVIEKFKSMPTNGKIVLITLIVAVIAILVLVILLIIRFKKSNEFEDDIYDDFNNDGIFDEVENSENSEIEEQSEDPEDISDDQE